MALNPYPPDAVERNIPGVVEAEQYLLAHRPSVLEAARSRRDAFQKEFEEDSDALIQMASFLASNFALAVVAALYLNFRKDKARHDVSRACFTLVGCLLTDASRLHRGGRAVSAA